MSHVFFEFSSNDWDAKQAIEIDNRGIIQIPAEQVEYKKIRRFIPREHEDELALAKALSRAHNMVGRRYDWWGIFGFLIKLVLWHVFLKTIKNPWNKPNKYFCSEYAITVLQSSGFKETKYLTPNDTHPGQLIEALDKSYNWVEVTDCEK